MKRVLLHDFRVIEGVKKGEDRILSRLYRDYYTPVRWMVKRNGGSEEDAATLWAEVVLEAYSQIRFQEEALKGEKLNAWLYSLGCDLWGEIKDGFDHYLPLVAVQVTSQGKNEKLHHALQAFESLESDTQELLTLIYWNRIGEEAAVRRFGVATAEASAYHQRALRNFKAAVQSEEVLPVLQSVLMYKGIESVRERLKDFELPMEEEPLSFEEQKKLNLTKDITPVLFEKKSSLWERMKQKLFKKE
ncbi:hypothetical protein V6R21_22475 [Limibacter armeniacum]|uniref:RNA polymerase sigma factor n=1 Tax=Limibacter armeniacum TaxID=466084 RepID=UPI002FE60B3C